MDNENRVAPILALYTKNAHALNEIKALDEIRLNTAMRFNPNYDEKLWFAEYKNSDIFTAISLSNHILKPEQFKTVLKDVRHAPKRYAMLAGNKIEDVNQAQWFTNQEWFCNHTARIWLVAARNVKDDVRQLIKSYAFQNQSCYCKSLPKRIERQIHNMLHNVYGTVWPVYATSEPLKKLLQIKGKLWEDVENVECKPLAAFIDEKISPYQAQGYRILLSLAKDTNLSTQELIDNTLTLLD